MADKNGQADFLSMFGKKAPDKKKLNIETKKETNESLPTITMEKEDSAKKERYTFSLSPSARERLTEVRNYYGKRSDSAFLEDIIQKFWTELNKEGDK